MRLLIIGAAGMLGAVISRAALRQGHEVHGLLRPTSDDRRLADLHQGVLTHRIEPADYQALISLIERLSPNAIVHAAFPTGVAAGYEARARTLHDGLSTTLCLLDALRTVSFDGSFVYLGSAMSYGREARPSHPSDPMKPITFRGVVKAAESLMISQFGQDSRCIVTELRVFTAFGPWQQRERFLPRLLIAALTDSRVQLTATPHFRDWIYVDDIAEACLQACRRTVPGAAVFNVCSGQLKSNHELARAVETMTRRQLIDETPYPASGLYGISGPVGALPPPAEGFSWQPHYDLLSGLAATWDWANSPSGRAYLLSRA